MDAEKIIQVLNLKPLPQEGGYFRETYRSEGKIHPNAATPALAGPRNFVTVIYFLVTVREFSRLHRLRHDEVFHFLLGDPIEMLQIDESGKETVLFLGPKLLEGQDLQAIVPAYSWQGLRLCPGGNWALLGVTVAPGFDFQDFELGKRQDLLIQFPKLKEKIIRFTDES